MTGFLLDTNIPSELTKPMPEPRVTAWVDAQDNASLYLSVVSVGELRRGFTALPQSKRRAQLEEWFEQYLLPLFAGRILPITQSIGNRWGVLRGECQLRGTPLNMADGMIAATALEHDLTLVTRNVKDFAGLGVVLLNPWDAV
ncbi:MAG TPA: type II toxin-antitoxin system VapC family toxin [Terriglobia bacterium]|nr:type II toxin-antitoxin system VapC family toxin [Terriglobia bacterium]